MVINKNMASLDIDNKSSVYLALSPNNAYIILDDDTKKTLISTLKSTDKIAYTTASLDAFGLIRKNQGSDTKVLRISASLEETAIGAQENGLLIKVAGHLKTDNLIDLQNSRIDSNNQKWINVEDLQDFDLVQQVKKLRSKIVFEYFGNKETVEKWKNAYNVKIMDDTFQKAVTKPEYFMEAIYKTNFDEILKIADSEAVKKAITMFNSESKKLLAKRAKSIILNSVPEHFILTDFSVNKVYVTKKIEKAFVEKYGTVETEVVTDKDFIAILKKYKQNGK